jgi:hypothetical protein
MIARSGRGGDAVGGRESSARAPAEGASALANGVCAHVGACLGDPAAATGLLRKC